VDTAISVNLSHAPANSSPDRPAYSRFKAKL
jgi:hypothetical protein